jgi:5-(carboxyamino)imidazole ribonucleotide synthase
VEKRKFPLGATLGVIGGGQLSRMLGQAAQARGFRFRVFAETKNDCAIAVTSQIELGNLHDFQKVAEFASHCDAVTFESEFFPAREFLIFLKEKNLKSLKAKFFPKLEHLALLQKRDSQKQWLQEQGIPTADFIPINKAKKFSSSDLEVLAQSWGSDLVLKKVFGGYDGYGTFFFPEIKKHLSQEKFAELLATELIAEKKVRFKRELAVSVACSEKQIVFLPLVETKQTDGRCDWVVGPVSHLGFSALKAKLKKALKKLGYRGLISFELFDTGKNLLVNEVAPRVHNSGHYSLDALAISQFEYHWRAGLNLQLEAPVALTKSFVMTNLIGTTAKEPMFPEILKGRLHWYGKHPNRPKRKMGHLNYLGDSKKKTLLLQALKERKKISL